MWLDHCRTALYRLYDETGTLLYIGISHQPDVRFEQHSKLKKWWPQVARREVQWFDDRPSAAAAEADAIRGEDPEHNGTYSPRRDPRVIRDALAADGVREVSLSLARPQLTSLIRGVDAGGEPVVLMNYRRREAVLVSYDFYERACEALGIERVVAPES